MIAARINTGLWSYGKCSSDYPAKLLLQSAKRVSGQWCADAVKMCQVADLRMKSQRGVDPEEELKLLLARLGAARK